MRTGHLARVGARWSGGMRSTDGGHRPQQQAQTCIAEHHGALRTWRSYGFVNGHRANSPILIDLPR
ncbi:hypothetical protein TI01_0723 [Lysobacter sp. A03]|nr:hypothetical protein TI01_0723 [Lysobacter sp. A03]